MEDFVPSMPQAYYDPFFEVIPPQVWDIDPEEIVP